ncbi:hypothetical protein [Longirhabdus pacifica]|uniref:hypothetical protein n=1 Tax=Longirhabdus pacifica TaxID=2305227 RepID=UPI0010092E1C|nr:hypothetical protein [Longirhabdus pacifica]
MNAKKRLSVVGFLCIGIVLFIAIVWGDQATDHRIQETNYEEMANSEPTNIDSKQMQVRITPNKQFKLDIEKVEPHVKFMFAESVNLEYLESTQNKLLNSTYDVWEDGSKVEENTEGFGSGVKNVSNGQFSVTLKSVPNSEHEAELVRAVHSSSGYGAPTTVIQLEIPESENERASTASVLEEAVTVPLGQYEPVAGYYVYFGDTNSSGISVMVADSMEEQAADADWAIVFKVGLFDDETIK